MPNPTAIVNPAGDSVEAILHYAKYLGTDAVRRSIFDCIYGRGQRARSKKQLIEAATIDLAKSQQVQNALDHLSKHHLISKIENNGTVKDGSRWLYGKLETIRAHRDLIRRYADDKNAAGKVATKRHPAASSSVTFVVKADAARRRSRGSQTGHLRKAAKFKIALLVTNPDRAASLQTGIEARDIDAAIKLGGQSDKVDLKVFLAPTFDTLVDALNTYKPDVLHFSGHGGGRNLLFDNERAGDDGGTVLDFEMIARLISMTSAKPKLLVMAACDTADGAAEFLPAVPAVVAMTDSIDDEAACEFSARFYRSLSSGASIRNALGQAKALLEHKGYADALLPTLVAASDAAADRAFL